MVVPFEILRMKGLTASAKLIWADIHGLERGALELGKPGAFKSVPRFAEDHGMSIDNVNKLLAKLRSMGLIESTQPDAGGLVYRRALLPGGKIKKAEPLPKVKKSMANWIHPQYDLPMNKARWDKLMEEHSFAMAKWAVQARVDWEAANGKPPAKDYAAAAANWIAKAKEFGNLPNLTLTKDAKSGILPAIASLRS